MISISRALVERAGMSILIAAMGAPASAAAFYLQEQSIRGAGRAFSGEAADQGAASLWWNPAAIGGTPGGDVYIGGSAILPRGKVSNAGTVIVRPGQQPAGVGGAEQVSRNPISNGYLPSGGIAYTIAPHVALGLAVTAPYDFTTNYHSDSWARYTADKTLLRTVDLQPSLAFSPARAITLGVGLNAEHVKASLSNFLPNLSPLLPDGHQTLSGKEWDYGWTVGAQLRGGPVTIGLSYKSSVRHVIKGTVVTAGLLGPLAGQNATIPTTATFRTPWQATAGARFRATEKLTLDAQLVRFGWSRFDAIRLRAPLNVAIPENYRNSWSYAGGLDYQATREWTLRAGVQRDLTPTRDGARDARVPDSNRWNFAAGTSYVFGHGITLDAAASYVAFHDAAIDRTTAAYAGTPAQTPILVDGRLTGTHVIVLGLGGRVAF